MAFRRLAGLQLSDEWKLKLAKHKLDTTKDVINHTDLELSELLDLSIHDAHSLTAAIAAQVTDPPRSAFELLQAATTTAVLSLCESVAALRVMPGLTELVGPAGVGKSQCCFTLAVAAYVAANQLTPLHTTPAPSTPSQHVVYIDTESTFSAQRIVQIATSKYPTILSSPPAITALLSHILVLPVATPSALTSTLSTIEETLVEHPTALLVLDSIAAPVRAHYSRSTLTKRADYLGSIAAQLKYISDRYTLPCIVTNQVRGGGSGSGGGGGGSGEGLSAALGVTWAHAVNTRWVLEDAVGGGGRRRLRVAKTAVYRAVSYGYVVKESGVVVGERVEGESESWDVMRMTIRRELEGAVEVEVEEADGGSEGAAAGAEMTGFYDDTYGTGDEMMLED